MLCWPPHIEKWEKLTATDLDLQTALKQFGFSDCLLHLGWGNKSFVTTEKNILRGDVILCIGQSSSLKHSRKVLPSFFPEIQVYSVDSKNGLRPRYDKRCMPDCLIDRYMCFDDRKPDSLWAWADFYTLNDQAFSKQFLRIGSISFQLKVVYMKDSTRCFKHLRNIIVNGMSDFKLDPIGIKLY